MDNAAILKLGSLKCVGKVLRIVELCFVILLLLWISTRLPFAVKISGEYFRQLVGVILSPCFIFILCNFIVLTLLLKSGGLFSGDYSSTFRNVGETELYDSFLENPTNFSSEKEALEIVYEDKRMIFEESSVKNEDSRGSDEEIETVKVKAMESKGPMRRTQSEKLDKKSVEEICVKLRRSETEKCRKVETSGEVSPSTAYGVDGLSNEEFQKAIEKFIAKQVKFHQQEKLAIVLHSQA
ncbi:PREDICTED: uncharacterized protein LOC109244181 [Nicotiana attenuata]|uniref:DUF4408 domain-containing protein n=1 Tax=Nicotiana attenuata TaxID=49451 RepID=A0A314L059_NICAT|nr:PREDICTED: uncharacterized protein LOC109244181 [Nicotiana attenuata]OIT34825.1 hypothetical protein A4A49_23862 [Nicotiana attenuata]